MLLCLVFVGQFDDLRRSGEKTIGQNFRNKESVGAFLIISPFQVSPKSEIGTVFTLDNLFHVC